MFAFCRRRLALFLPVLVTGVLWQIPAAQAADAMLGRPRFDPTDRQLIVPFTGEAPAFVRGSLDAPLRIFLDFEANTRIGGGHDELPGHPLYSRWAMAPRGPGRTRLVLHLRAPVALTVAIDPRRDALVLLGEHAPVVRPTPMPSLRPTPRPSLRPGPRPSTAANPQASPTVRPSVMPSAWPSTSPRPSASPSAAPSPTPSSSVSPAPLHSQLPAPEASLIPAPEASLNPAPGASLIPAPDSSLTPAPETTLPPSPALQSGSEVVVRPRMRLGLQAPILALDEQGAGLSYQGAWVRALGAAWLIDALPSPGWGARAEALMLSSAGQDAGVLHARQEWRGAFDFLRAESVGPLTFQVGVGAMGRYEVASHAGTNPISVGFAPWRAFIGPELLMGMQLVHPALPGWSVRAVGAASPYVVALLPQGALPSGLWSHRVDAALVAPVGPLSLSLGVRRWGMNGQGYQELVQGPFVALSAPWGW